MTTQYTKTLTLAVPKPLIEAANHLACLMGESAADINTFRRTGYTFAGAALVDDVYIAPGNHGVVVVGAGGMKGNGRAPGSGCSGIVIIRYHV